MFFQFNFMLIKNSESRVRGPSVSESESKLTREGMKVKGSQIE